MIVVTATVDGDVQIEHVPCEQIPKEQIVDTNGAGDSFVGAFFASIIQGHSIVEATRAGAHLAGIVIQKSGCTFE